MKKYYLVVYQSGYNDRVIRELYHGSKKALQKRLLENEVYSHQLLSITPISKAMAMKINGRIYFLDGAKYK